MSAQTRSMVFKDTRQMGSKSDMDKIEVLEFACKVREDPEAKPKITRSLARVYNADPLDVAKECAMVGYNVAMLTEINENFPIPGMTKGGMQGQESEVLLRSNYCRRINDNYYPLKRRQLVYVGGLTVHKDKVYELYQKSFSVAMIGSTIVRRPTLHSRQENGTSIQCYANRSEEELMRDTINSIFHLAHSKGHDTLVLPAIGCEQGHPVDTVIEFFNEAMERFDIKYVFFAVKSYIEYKPHCAIFMAFHKGIERKYTIQNAKISVAKETPKKNQATSSKKLSQVEKEIQDDAAADEDLEADILGGEAGGSSSLNDDDLGWLEEIADSTAQTAAKAAAEEEEPEVKVEAKSEVKPKKKTTKKKVSIRT